MKSYRPVLGGFDPGGKKAETEAVGIAGWKVVVRLLPEVFFGGAKRPAIP
jgi:hypothetical protein